MILRDESGSPRSIVDAGAECPSYSVALQSLLRLPTPKARCRLAPPFHLRDRKQSRREQVARLSCRRWHCQACAAALRHEAGWHFGRLLLEHDGDLHVANLDPACWEADSKHLRRRRASWVRIMGTALIGTVPLDGACLVSAEEAVIALGDRLRDIVGVRLGDGRRFHPITSSRGWSMPWRPPSSWVRLGSVRVRNPETVLKLLASHGLEGKKKRWPAGDEWRVSWPVPEGWTQQQCDHLAAQLRAIGRAG